MAPDDRDRIFDKALSRHLRSMASSPAATDLSSTPPSSSSPCLDPEILAAYHERSLLPEDMNSAKEHIAGCAHCQALLAQLELTDSIPLSAPVQEQRQAAAARPAPQAKVASLRPIRGPRWHWLVPAGALAAGLLVWIGLHENQRPRLLTPSEVKVAKVEEPPAPLPSLRKEPPLALSAPQAMQHEPLSQSGGVVGGIGGAAPKTIPAPQENLKQPQRADSGASVTSNLISSAKESELPKDAKRDSSGALIATRNQADLEAKNVANGAPQDQAALQNQAANILTQNQIISQKVAGPSPLTQAEQTKKAKSSPATSRYSAAVPSAPAPPTPSAAAAFSDNASMQAAFVPNQHLIAAPSSAVRWLAGRAGLIEFSSDSGASWSAQTSGVAVDLLTGSAPSDKICWMVGRSGTILLTTDSGAHWSTVHSPINEDLGGVRASDALHATIWNLPTTKSFETSDGGVTWKLVPAP